MARLKFLPICLCLFVHIFIGTFRSTFGRGTGAPIGACITMTPGHTGTTAQTDPAPFTVSLSSSVYTDGMSITVTVSGTPKFQGILLQGRKADGTDTPVGEFMNPPNGFQLMKCTNDNDAVTHTSNADKASISVTWKAPTGSTDDLVIMATVAEVKEKYWVKLKSGTLKFDTKPATTGTNTSPNPAATTGTNASTNLDSGETDQSNSEGGKEEKGNNVADMKAHFIWTTLSAFFVALF